MLGWLCRKIFFGWGWKIDGHIPNEVPKKLYVVIPHTSNWDFPVGILMKYAFDMEVGFIAKSSLFVFPFGYLFKALGGVPVDRSKKSNLIEKVVEVYNSKDRFCTAIAPEGTRKKVNRLKSGFYYIAKNANIPIVYVTFDWQNKVVKYAPPKMPEATKDAEITFAEKHFEGVLGRIPEKSFGA